MSKRDRDICADAVRDASEINRNVVSVDPDFIAEVAMGTIRFDYALHNSGWYGCKQHMLQLARAYLRGKHDPKARAEAVAIGQEDIFPETLQDRYPLRPRRDAKTGEWSEPVYTLRSHLAEDDRWYNIERLGSTASSLVKHKDALEAETVALFGPRKAEQSA